MPLNYSLLKDFLNFRYINNLYNKPKHELKRKKNVLIYFIKYIWNSHMNIWRKNLLLDTFTWLQRCMEYRKVTSLYSESRGASVSHVTMLISSIFDELITLHIKMRLLWKIKGNVRTCFIKSHSSILV